MRNRKISLRLLTLIGSALMCLPVLSQQTIVSIHNMEPEKLFQEGFRLNSEQEIEIVAVAAHQRDRYKLASAAWVMDIANREIVWELTDANSSWKSKYLREYKDRVSLPAGAYQLFFTNYVRDYYKDEKSWSIVRFFLDKDDRDYEDLIKDFSIEVNGNGTALKENEVRRLSEEARQKAAVSLLARNEEEFLQQGFKVSKPTEFNIYAVGEGGNDGMYDYGWIMNTADRERVWVMKYRDSDDAGGSYKNRVVRDEITLPKGEYVAY
nr:hypothetical protein [Calditrichia bacterium]